MSEETKITRRLLLGSTVAAATVLAGCGSSGGEDTQSATDAATNTATDTATATATDTATDTATETETRTEEPTTVENFTSPNGASRDGIAPSELYSTHRSSIIDGGSATVSTDRATDYGNSTESIQATNTYNSNGMLLAEDNGNLTETLWSPSSEDTGYVQMDTGFEQRYRIDNQAPRPERALKLRLVNHLLVGGQWSEAKEVTGNAAGEPVVIYESVGIASEQDLLRVRPGDNVSEFEATISITESGLISEYSYDITVERDTQTRQQQETTTVSMVGETTVEEPSWAATAQENGVQFNVSATDDRKAVMLELVNGGVPSDSRVQLSSNRFGVADLGQSLSAGDTLYLSFSENSDLQLGFNETPSEATELSDFVFVAIQDGQFSLFEGDISL
jgi:hypothetical protein